MEKKIHRIKKDQKKHNHREAVKGHFTKKHFVNTVRTKEAEEEIKNMRDEGHRRGKS
jgi:hypothetical protein